MDRLPVPGSSSRWVHLEVSGEDLLPAPAVPSTYNSCATCRSGAVGSPWLMAPGRTWGTKAAPRPERGTAVGRASHSGRTKSRRKTAIERRCQAALVSADKNDLRRVEECGRDPVRPHASERRGTGALCLRS